MNANLQRRVQRYGWDKAADFYENHWREQLASAQSRMLEFADLQPGEQVLDVGCGTGLVTFDAAAAVGEGGEVVGTDISSVMIERATQLGKSRGLGQCRFLRSDAESIGSLGDDSFDAAICALGLMYFPDPIACLREMRRVTRPGGRLAAAVWGARKNCGWAEIFPIVDSRVESDVCPLFYRLGTGDTLRDEALGAGWIDPVVDRLSTTLRYSCEEDALGAVFDGGPVALAYSRFDETMKEAAHAEYLASIAAFRVGDGYAVPGEFVILRAERNQE
jgi:ubiquinone/menaquinone biosynthesis C-methylase UbiE